MIAGRVEALLRYPVKSMAGVELAEGVPVVESPAGERYGVEDAAG